MNWKILQTVLLIFLILELSLTLVLIIYFNNSAAGLTKRCYAKTFECYNEVCTAEFIDAFYHDGICDCYQYDSSGKIVIVKSVNLNCNI